MHVDYPKVRTYIPYFLLLKVRFRSTAMEVNGCCTMESVSHSWSLESNNDNCVMYSDQEVMEITASKTFLCYH